MNIRALTLTLAVALSMTPWSAHAARKVEAKKVEATLMLPSGWTSQDGPPFSKKITKVFTKVLSYTGTITVKDKNNKVTTYTNGQVPVLNDGDAVSVAGGTLSLDTGNGILTAGDGAGFTVKGGGAYSVTAGSVVVTSGDKSVTVQPGQTVSVVTSGSAATQNVRAGTTVTTTNINTAIVVTSPQQETTNGGTTSTVSPSAP